ncbi:MAG TPA: hypothetical protein VGG45_19865 [Terracidiphilus sp.]
MKRDRILRWWVDAAVLLFLAAASSTAEKPTAAAVAGFNSYVGHVEARLADQHRSADGFVAAAGMARAKAGELVIEQLTPAGGLELPGALLHDWRGTAFVPGAKGEDFERVMRDFKVFPRIYSPEVLRANSQTNGANRYEVTMRVRQRHVLTVVMDMTYDTTFGRLDAQHGYSISRSTQITEIEAAGTPTERALSVDEEHGFLWRLNNYWSYEERDGGLYIQVESVSLSRTAPKGLGWMIGPFIESVPRESLEFTLRATKDALKE